MALVGPCPDKLGNQFNMQWYDTHCKMFREYGEVQKKNTWNHNKVDFNYTKKSILHTAKHSQFCQTLSLCARAINHQEDNSRHIFKTIEIFIFNFMYNHSSWKDYVFKI